MKLEIWAVNELYCRANGSELGGIETGEYFKEHDAGYKYVQEKYDIQNPDNPYSNYYLSKKILNIIDGWILWKFIAMNIKMEFIDMNSLIF